MSKLNQIYYYFPDASTSTKDLNTNRKSRNYFQGLDSTTFWTFNLQLLYIWQAILQTFGLLNFQQLRPTQQSNLIYVHNAISRATIPHTPHTIKIGPSPLN